MADRESANHGCTSDGDRDSNDNAIQEALDRRRQELEEWRRKKAASKKTTTPQKTPQRPISSKPRTATMPATAPRPAASKMTLDTAAATARRLSQPRPAASPKKRASPTRPRAMLIQQRTPAKPTPSSGTPAAKPAPPPPTARTVPRPGTPRVATPFRRARATPHRSPNSEELRQRVLRASAKKMARLRREGGGSSSNLQMKLGLLSVQLKVREEEQQRREVAATVRRQQMQGNTSSTGKQRVARSLADELSSARSSPTSKGKPASNSPRRPGQSSPSAQRLARALGKQTTSTKSTSSNVPEEATPPPPKLPRVTPEQLAKIRTALDNLHIYQPVALRMTSGQDVSLVHLHDAPVLTWFRVDDARIAAMRGDTKLARTMLWILGAQPAEPPSDADESADLAPAVRWPYQQADYWISRGKFEEACGAIAEAFNVYEEAVHVLPEVTEAFRQAFQEFADRMTRSGLNSEKTKQGSTPSSSVKPSTSKARRRVQLLEKLEIVFPTLSATAAFQKLRRSAMAAFAPPARPAPPVVSLSPCTFTVVSPAAVEMITMIDVASSDDVTSAYSPATSVVDANAPNATASRQALKQLASASDQDQLPTATLAALSLYPDSEGDTDPCDDADEADDADVQTITGEDGAEWESEEEDDDEQQAGDAVTSKASKTPSPQKRISRLPRPHTIGQPGRTAAPDATITALTPIRASRIQKRKFGVDMIISPVRRSTRLLRLDSGAAAPSRQSAETEDDDTSAHSSAPPSSSLQPVDEQRLARILREQGFAYLPNKALSIGTTKSDETAPEQVPQPDPTCH